MSIGENIKRLRKSRKMTQIELAQNLGKSESIVRKYESGSVQPSVEILYHIADILNADIWDIINKDDNIPINISNEQVEKIKKSSYLKQSASKERSASKEQSEYEKVKYLYNWLENTDLETVLLKVLYFNKDMVSYKDAVQSLFEINLDDSLKWKFRTVESRYEFAQYYISTLVTRFINEIAEDKKKLINTVKMIDSKK